MCPTQQLSKQKLAHFFKDIKRLKAGMPLQYLLGEWEFYSIRLSVGKGVLIPRPDTETLVDAALELLEGKAGAQVADLCSGSGAAAIALAKNRPDLKCYAVELSRQAIAYLRKNIKQNELESRVLIVRADVKKKLKLAQLDLIVCNPPYLSAEDMQRRTPQVCFEPPMALFAGDDGLEFYPVIAKRALELLKPGGSLAVEVGAGQAKRVCELFKVNGFYDIRTRSDAAGIERCVCALRA